jgi:enoyl-CoA hydratase
LTRLCGEGIAARIILSGDVVGGREAERIGLVQWAFAAADFNRSAAEIVSRTANLSADAQKMAKNGIRLAVHEQMRGSQAEMHLDSHAQLGDQEARARVSSQLTSKPSSGER